MCLIHKWSSWSKPMQNYNGHKVQYSFCTKCNKARFRKWWDGQTNISTLTEAHNQIQEKEQNNATQNNCQKR